LWANLIEKVMLNERAIKMERIVIFRSLAVSSI
jgi:hypothetical protein